MSKTNYFRTAAARDQKLAFLAAAALGDTLALLGLADWYEENGDGKSAARWRADRLRYDNAWLGRYHLALIVRPLLSRWTAFDDYEAFEAAKYTPTMYAKGKQRTRLILILRALGHKVFDGTRTLEPLTLEGSQ